MTRGLGSGILTAEEASVRQVGLTEGVLPSEGASLWRGTTCAHAFYSYTHPLHPQSPNRVNLQFSSSRKSSLMPKLG